MTCFKELLCLQPSRYSPTVNRTGIMMSSFTDEETRVWGCWDLYTVSWQGWSLEPGFSRSQVGSNVESHFFCFQLQATERPVPTSLNNKELHRLIEWEGQKEWAPGLVPFIFWLSLRFLPPLCSWLCLLPGFSRGWKWPSMCLNFVSLEWGQYHSWKEGYVRS